MAISRPTETTEPAPGETRPLAERQKIQLECRAPHVDLAELTSASGLLAIISQRRNTGQYTFAIFRTFRRHSGQVERGSFIPEDLGADYLAFTSLVLERIAEIRRSGTAPFKERGPQ